MLININPVNPQERLIAKVCDCLADGGIIVYPTDTAYEFGCDINNKKSIIKIYRIKQLKENRPFSFICTDFSEASEYGIITDYAFKIMKKALPGPYTFILRATDITPKLMVSRRKSVGIRIPDNPIAQSIVKKLGRPIISTSVKNSNNLITDSHAINERFGREVDYIIDCGVELNEKSTIIDLIDDYPIILREGKGSLKILV